MSRLLRAVDLAALPTPDALDVVRAALDGSGDAVLPTAAEPAAARARDALGAGSRLGPHEDDDRDPTAFVIATSGSTGRPKGALLQASALHASASATHERLGGPGRWLLALTPHHVAGLQVLVRSALAGTEPLCLDLHKGFDLKAFACAAVDLVGSSVRAYTALVPTQLVRILQDDGPALGALARLDAVLLGGATASPRLLARAAEAGVHVVTTYGTSETCGGCVYDGVPLDGVQVEVGDRVRLGGPVVARGYRSGEGTAFTTDGVTRWFTTDDVGELRHGRLVVHGRADDVLVTGGVKVSPQAVEQVLAELPGVAESLVVGVPDEEWGQRVVALVVGEPPSLNVLRQRVASRLGAAAAPRKLLRVDVLPHRSLGKPDRAAAARLAAERLGGGHR